jgi:NAD(P)-dependent dehydrogenase (short-subunit alcohol dehydrogenase family)
MKLDSSIAAIVTGGASGLGEATARALAAKGVRVALFDMNAEAGEKVAGEIGGTFCQVNVADAGSVEAGFEKARAAHGQERILVNCAGIATAIKTVGRDKESGAIVEYPLDYFERVIAVNLVGTFRCIAKAAAGMVQTDPIDEDGQRGVMGMTLPVARDLMNDGIRVNTILPGIFWTPMMRSLPEKAQVALAAAIPFPKRLGRAEEYAQTALFLIEHDYINAESIRMDGGIRMGPR